MDDEYLLHKEELADLEDFAEFSNKISEAPRKRETIPFWAENPNALFNPYHILEFFPVEKMQYSQKLNAITRMVILSGLVLFGITQNINILLVSLITIGSISLVFYNKQPKPDKKVRFDLDDENAKVETFLDQTQGLVKITLEREDKHIQNEVFDVSKPNNPFSNVLLTDYEENPNKKPAPASYNRNNNSDILEQAKEFVKEANPDQPDIADKLFKNLGDELQFEQSMRPFYSTPNTRVVNDQQAFADFCYGSMVSCKEGNMFACSRKYQTMPTA